MYVILMYVTIISFLFIFDLTYIILRSYGTTVTESPKGGSNLIV